jgi:hypothetical protein
MDWFCSIFRTEPITEDTEGYGDGGITAKLTGYLAGESGPFGLVDVRN